MRKDSDAFLMTMACGLLAAGVSHLYGEPMTIRDFIFYFAGAFCLVLNKMVLTDG